MSKDYQAQPDIQHATNELSSSLKTTLDLVVKLECHLQCRKMT